MKKKKIQLQNDKHRTMALYSGILQGSMNHHPNLELFGYLGHRSSSFACTNGELAAVRESRQQIWSHIHEYTWKRTMSIIIINGVPLCAHRYSSECMRRNCNGPRRKIVNYIPTYQGHNVLMLFLFLIIFSLTRHLYSDSSSLLCSAQVEHSWPSHRS